MLSLPSTTRKMGVPTTTTIATAATATATSATTASTPIGHNHDHTHDHSHNHHHHHHPTNAPEHPLPTTTTTTTTGTQNNAGFCPTATSPPPVSVPVISGVQCICPDPDLNCKRCIPPAPSMFEMAERRKQLRLQRQQEKKARGGV
mmetsp:Transcript_27445/g.63518  ORF Transcript_27445/g.63518 Transcript_27445/m.63518 type:complete len:146 (-) Transcript_27445:3-440(-)